MNAEQASAEDLFFAGTRELQNGNLTSAEEIFRQALQLEPDFAEAHANLALTLERQGRLEEAEAAYQTSLQIDEDNSQVHGNLATLLAGAKQFSEAETAYRRAVNLAPKNPSLWSNLGVLYASMKREREAEECYRLAISLDTPHVSAHFNLAYLLLRQGRFEEGWACLEYRNWYPGLEQVLPFPRWQGESLAGRQVLIGCESGHGDMIQFCRYASLLKARGATRVGVLCHPALVRLFTTLSGVDQVFGLDGRVPGDGWDFWVSPLSLPYVFETRESSIPADIPYLRADEELRRRWASRLPADGLRIGLAWRGNPRFENDKDRSLHSLSILAPLWDARGVSFVSLQKGEGGDEGAVPPWGQPLYDAGSAISDFADSAAVMANLDLVITVDTAVAHLAGALGVKCWLMLPWYRTDWRWLEGRDDSPWYPGSMRLFRQPSMGDWDSVVSNILQALIEFRTMGQQTQGE